MPDRTTAGTPTAVGAAPDPQETLHSLQVYQVELAQQNEELLAARAELDDSLKRYVELYEHSPVGLLTLGGQGRIALLNACARAWLGPMAVTGAGLPGLVCERSRPALQRLMDGAADGHIDVSVPVAGADDAAPGSEGERLLQIEVFRRETAGDQLLLAMSDVTARRRAEAELRHTQEILALSNRVARIGHWEIDLVLRQARWSEMVREIHGVDADYRPTPDSALHFCIDDASRHTLRAAMDRAIARAEAFDVELCVRSQQGREVWVRTIGMPEFVDGRCLRLYGTCQDIDARVRLEQARLAQAQAEAANRAKTTFLARMSHELRTPLNAVLGFSDLLALGDTVRASPTATRQVEHIHRAGEHLLALVDEVLDLARIESGTLKLQDEAVELRDLVGESIALVAPLAARHRVQVQIGGQIGPLTAQADRMRLQQVLINLLSNAIKYNRAGGRVDLLLGSAGENVELAVRDTGPGLTKEQIDCLFEPFNRLGAQNGVVEGTGLGLVITRQLVVAMGGELEVIGRPGEGSTFTVRLRRVLPGPAADEAAAAAPPTAPPTAPQVEGVGTIVYVEDNSDNAELVRHAVALRPGLQLRLAADGVAGLAAIRELRPRLALIDLDLPLMDGIELVRHVRADPSLNHVICVAVSAKAMASDTEQALAAGFSEHITKPVRMVALFALLELARQ